MGIDVIKTW